MVWCLKLLFISHHSVVERQWCQEEGCYLLCHARKQREFSCDPVSHTSHLASKKKKKKKKEKDTSLWSLEPFYAERIQKLWWPITLSVLPWSRLCSRHNALLVFSGTVQANACTQTNALMHNKIMLGKHIDCYDDTCFRYIFLSGLFLQS